MPRGLEPEALHRAALCGGIRAHVVLLLGGHFLLGEEALEHVRVREEGPVLGGLPRPGGQPLGVRLLGYLCVLE